MLVLLPPSEGKTAPLVGPPLDLAGLTAPELTPLRDKVLDALAEVSARPDAVRTLGVGASLAADVARNVTLRDAPTGPATLVYTGVLHAAAGLAAVPEDARVRAERTVRVLSGLWGVVVPFDRIPAYRLSMRTDLPGIGPLAAVWRGVLGDVLDARAADELVVDCRSAAYLAAWHPPRSSDWVQIRVVRERVGVRTVVSHHAKHARGLLTRHLVVRAAPEPQDAADLAGAAAELVGDTLVGVELDAAVGRAGTARVLTLVVR